MCILFLYVDPNPSKSSFRLILASNRDEYYTRTAVNAQLCPLTKIIGGRDMTEGREGGMWLGAAVGKQKSLRVGALLNVTGEEPKRGGPVHNRGPIVTSYLMSDSTFQDYVHTLPLDKLNAFNFVGVEIDEESACVHHQSNAPIMYTKFEGGKQALGFGNSTLTYPFKKVRDGVEEFTKLVDVHGNLASKNKLIDELIQFLKSDTRHLPDDELQRRRGVGFEYLSSIFVKVVPVNYGTRTHSVILMDHDWNVEFHESTLQQPIDPEAPEWETSRIKCRL